MRYPFKSQARVALGQCLRYLQQILSDRIGFDLIWDGLRFYPIGLVWIWNDLRSTVIQ